MAATGAAACSGLAAGVVIFSCGWSLTRVKLERDVAVLAAWAGLVFGLEHP